jgi:hypothetical protein
LPGDRLGTVRAAYASAAQNSYPNKDWEIQGDKLLTNLPAVY